VKLDRHWIAAHIPHQGSMCLLEEVLYWDAQQLTCRSVSHRDAGNPLRAHDRLGAACAIEYAAQALAVHGALLRPTSQGSHGFAMLTSARAVDLVVARLDDIHGDLLVGAQRLHADGRGALYSFAVHEGAQLLAQGRLTVLLDAAQAAKPAAAGAPRGTST
jgi:predicted hotdog family 3-hydroxylacyl-ACP dehydratase